MLQIGWERNLMEIAQFQILVTWKDDNYVGLQRALGILSSGLVYLV